MQLNNTTQYAIRMLNYMANSHKSLHRAKELSEKLEIPYKFLTKIMTELVKADFIVSIRGREGGYTLAKPASEIMILDILNQFGELIQQNECVLGIGTCDSEKKCSLHDQWVAPKEMMIKMFAETSLENLEGDEFKI
ncbi:Rrf2 family transcriptional regulator [Sulfurimonas sp. SAG-AH-194-C21]|nr:Rrf2 family transcriptional regulator [Sulfurimonas sp. SAG-AH-194-C21]MDF1882736.1 Rrf2 family transcriptional regulator [Sulfurimonas sp. SAG-AH-194-C21]